MKATKVWFEGDRIHLQTDDGRKGSLPIRLYPRLYNATEEQRNNFSLSHFGIHWPDIDEDLSYEGFFDSRNNPPENNPVGELFFLFPELVASQIARRGGLNSKLVQQYINGVKVPSEDRKQYIESLIHRLGKELCEFSFNKK